MGVPKTADTKITVNVLFRSLYRPEDSFSPVKYDMLGCTTNSTPSVVLPMWDSRKPDVNASLRAEGSFRLELGEVKTFAWNVEGRLLLPPKRTMNCPHAQEKSGNISNMNYTK